MDVTVERYMRRKIVTDSASPQFFYLRQKPGTCKTVDVDTLAAAIQKSCAMTKGDVKHVIEALVEEVQENLVNGNKVKLNLFGTFHMTFCCPGVATSAECTVKNIKRVNIRFVPDKELKLVNNSHAVTRSPANVTFRMCTGRFYRTKTFDIPVLPYIIMITCAGEAPAQVVCG